MGTMIKSYCAFIISFLLLLCNCGILGGSAKEEYEKGLKLTREGNVKQAFKAFKSAAKKAPDSARYYFAAGQTAPDQNTSFMYTKFAWEKGLKNPAVFTALLRLSFHVDKKKKLEYALTLFGELPDSVATDNYKGDLFFEFGEYDKAYSLWDNEFKITGKSFYCPKIARALVKMGKIDEALDFLYSCKKDKKLDADGYTTLASLLAMQYKFKEADRLFAEVSESNVYNDQLRLEEATYLVFNGRGNEADALLDRPAGPGSPGMRGILNFRMHTLRIYRAVSAGRRKLTDSLLAHTPADTILKKKAVDVLAATKFYLENDDTSAYEKLKTACSKLPPDPVTTIFMARAAMKKRLFKEAQAIYNRLPGVVMWAPPVVAERAQAIALAGNDETALKIISFMHSRHVFSRQSLELFRNLTLKKDLIEKSEAAQQLLEQQYSNDIGLKWKGLLLAIKAEKIDSALAIARQLSADYPKEERFELTKLTLLLMKKEYRKVLNEISISSLPVAKTKPIEAAAWKGLGDTTQAIVAYEEAIKGRTEPVLMMQLAEMYFQTRVYKKATALYTRLLDDTAESMFKDSLQMAVLLNNNAWTIMTAGEKNLTAALDMAKKAFILAPGNLHILDTYTSILFEAGKYKECIALLEKTKPALTQKRLLVHLSRSYEKRGDDNKAKRYLQDALQCKEEEQKLTSLIPDDEIKKEIERLSAKN